MFVGTVVIMGVSGTGKTEAAARSGQGCENDALRGSDRSRPLALQHPIEHSALGSAQPSSSAI
jgi:hypothetical protein